MLTTRLLKSRSDRQHSKRENSRRTGNRDAAVFHRAEKRNRKKQKAFDGSLWEQGQVPVETNVSESVL